MSFESANENGFPGSEPVGAQPHQCERCGGGPLAARSIQTALWRDGRLVVVRGIPAMVCSDCGEEYVSDLVALGLDQLWGKRGTVEIVDQMIVPVYAWDTVLAVSGEAEA